MRQLDTLLSRVSPVVASYLLPSITIPFLIILNMQAELLVTPNSSKMSVFNDPEVLAPSFSTKDKYLCLTICGYRKSGMSETAYRNHMVDVSAPMTKDLMVKYGIKRWTQVSRLEKGEISAHHWSFNLKLINTKRFITRAPPAC
jgi:hypothetical protein